MMINEHSKSIIYFRDWHAKKMGKRCFYMDTIIWRSLPGSPNGKIPLSKTGSAASRRCLTFAMRR